MIELSPDTPVYIALSPIDFRAGINRLAAQAAEIFSKDPAKGGIFLFHNKRKTDMKLICYDANGFFLGHKRLSRGKLSWWPRTAHEAYSISVSELNRLLKGVDPRGGFNPEWQKLVDGKRSSKPGESVSL